jgi:hypothetical protein
MAVGAIREFYNVRQRRLVLNVDFNARSERFIFDWAQNVQERHDRAIPWVERLRGAMKRTVQSLAKWHHVTVKLLLREMHSNSPNN